MTDAWLTVQARALPDASEMTEAGRGESMVPPSGRAVSAAMTAIASAHRYLAESEGPLRAALAAYTGLDAGRIVLGAGSGALLHLVGTVALGPGRSVVTPRPGGPHPALAARLSGGRVIAAALGADGASDPDTLLGAIAPDTAMVMCATPHDATGVAMGDEALRHLAEAVPDRAMLVVDETYGEFDPQADTLTMLRARRGPWVVTRSFSKAYALAGLRVGCALCSDRRVADVLRAAQPGFMVGAAAQAGAAAALADRDHLRWILEVTQSGRYQITRGLRGIGLAPLISAANFVTVDIGRAADPVAAELASRGIAARALRDRGYENFLRLPVGMAEANRRAIDGLYAVLAAGAGP